MFKQQKTKMKFKKTMNKLRLKIALFFLTTDEKIKIFNAIVYTSMKTEMKFNEFYL